MGRSAMVNGALLTATAAVGVGIAVAGALLDPKYAGAKPKASAADGLDDRFSTVSSNDFDPNEPTKEFRDMCSSYHHNKETFSAVFRVLGQMLIAPIVFVGVERVNAAYGNPLCFAE